MNLYKLTVDGAGIEYARLNHRIALEKFKACCDLSKGDDGACVWKSVTLLRDGEIFKQYPPPPDTVATLQPGKE